MQQQMNFLDTLYGKMSQEPSVPTTEKTSRQSSKPSVPYAKATLMFLDLRPGMGGNLLGSYWEMDIASHGKYTMRVIGAYPNEERESTLSQVLQMNAPEKYSLSPKACAGIIRRAEKRGKELPDMLKEALMEVIGQAGGLNEIEEESDETEYESEDEEYEDEEE